MWVRSALRKRRESSLCRELSVVGEEFMPGRVRSGPRGICAFWLTTRTIDVSLRRTCAYSRFVPPYSQTFLEIVGKIQKLRQVLRTHACVWGRLPHSVFETSRDIPA